MKIPELLAPIGSMEHLKVAVFSGASSIYLSGKKFGARQYAENLSFKQIKEAVKFAHLYNVKIYVTVNTLIKEEELLTVIEYILNLYKIGVDAVLIQDVGLIKLIKEIIPNLAIHSSTQMNIQNKEGIKWAVANGIKRVVLPRELNISEIRELTDFAHENGVEVEIFIHGALCYSYSGRCLFSSFKGGRSGNRGTCAQPCRQKYQIALKTKEKKININETLVTSNEEYFLSPKDLSLISELETLENIGVDSLKIEGRMRNKEYVAIVVNSYRKLLNKLKYMKNSNFNKYSDEFKKKRKINKKFKNKRGGKQSNSLIQNVDYKKTIEDLKLVFNRDFTTGHLLNQNHTEILNTENPGDSGLYIGKIDSFSKKTGEIAISLESNLITIPEKGDGLLIKGKKLISNKNEKRKKYQNNKNPKNNTNNNKKNYQNNTNNNKKNYQSNANYPNNVENSRNIENSYGFELSKDPILKVKSGTNSQKLIIKKVKENKEINIKIDENSKVYLTKRKAILDHTKNLLHDNTKQIIRRSRVFIQFETGKSNYPILKGNLILANGKKIVVSKKSDVSWEIAKNKPITKEQLKKQLSKIGDLPIYIEKISINYKEDLFTPISEINKLRREFFKDLENELTNSYLPDENEFKIVKNNFKNFKKIENKEFIENIRENKENEKEAIGSSGKNKKIKNSLAIYLNNLKVLKSLNRKSKVYDRVYLEIPPKNQHLSFESEKDDETRNKIDISYMVNFIKDAIAISKDQKYELIWKWPDIAHQRTIDDFTKTLAILKKLSISINVMSSSLGIANYLKEKFEIDVYGSYPLNIYNKMSILNLNEYKLLTLSPELSKSDIYNLNKDYLKSKDYHNYKKSLINSSIPKIPNIEILVHGNIELLISKKDLISKKLMKKLEKTLKSKKNKINESANEFSLVLNDLNNNEFPIKKDINENDRILLNSRDFCLLNHISYLKSISFENFAIDGRWKSIDYIKNIGAYYKKAIDSADDFKIDLKNIENTESLYFNDITEGNFIKGLKSK